MVVGFQVVATEGYLPASGTEGTVNLYEYYSSSAGDNYMTTSTTAPAGEEKQQSLSSGPSRIGCPISNSSLSCA